MEVGPDDNTHNLVSRPRGLPRDASHDEIMGIVRSIETSDSAADEEIDRRTHELRETMLAYLGRGNEEDEEEEGWNALQHVGTRYHMPIASRSR